MPDFMALYTALSGIQAAQAAIDTTSHNIANAGTEGYTRQRVELASRLAAMRPFGPVGNGVAITDITRSRHELLDTRVRTSLGEQERFAVLTGLLGQVELTLAEPDNGVTAALGEMFASFEDLGLDPADTAARQNVVGSLEALGSRIRAMVEAWDAIGSQTVADLGNAVSATNELLAQVADANRQVLQSGSGRFPPNDLLDRRDLALDELAKMAGVRVTITDNGAARVSLNGLALVHDAEVSQLSFDPGTMTLTHSSGASVVPGGALGGLMNFLVDELPAQMQAMNDFVAGLVTTLNTQHAAGFTTSGAPGGPLFSVVAGQEAATITVAVTDPADIAAASSGGPPVPLHDGSNAGALAGYRFTPAIGSATLEEVMRDIVGQIGSSLSATASTGRAYGDLAASAELARTDVHGVSIDEEMVNLLSSQRAFEAAARVMTAVDQALDTLINGTGIVGR